MFLFLVSVVGNNQVDQEYARDFGVHMWLAFACLFVQDTVSAGL